MRLGVVFLASAAAATAVSGASGSPVTRTSGATAARDLRARTVHFATLWRTSGEGTGKLPYTTGEALSAAAVVWRRKGDALLTGSTFVSLAHLGALDGFPWSKRFILLAAIVRPTTGYAISVKRVSYQHPTSDIDQFCVIAAVSRPRPGQPVEHRRTVSSHVVQIARKGFGLALSSAAVLRSSDGKLLSTTTAFGPVRPAACRA